MELRENGSLVHDGIAVGSFAEFDDAATAPGTDRDTLTIDLGWAKAAGLRVVIRDDRAVDHHRHGIFLDRA